MVATRVTDRLKDLLGDTRRFTCSITGDNNEGAATWISGGDFSGTTFRILSMVTTRTAGAPMPTYYGVKDGTKTVSGFTIETDGQPGTGNTWTFEGIAVMN